MIKGKLFLTMALVAISFNSCKDKDDDPVELVSGPGGNLTLVAKPQHHGQPILNMASYPDSAMVKFNTQNFPGDNPALYDAIYIGANPGEDFVRIAGIKPGKMYIFMAGWDSTINQRVTGGIPFNTSQAAGELVVVVPVTEI